MVDPSPRLITINELRAAISGRPSGCKCNAGEYS
jgi:hypothetical protein